MVEVRFRGRTGNQLFQYCFARILAFELDYALSAPPVEGFPSTQAKIIGDVNKYPLLNVFELYGAPGDWRTVANAPGDAVVRRVSIPRILRQASGRRVCVDGFFEYFPYYEPYIDRIKSEWIVPDAEVVAPQQHPDDMVVHVRRGDMVALGNAMPFEYFERVLDCASFRRLHIVTDFPDDPFFDLFHSYGVNIISTASSYHGSPRNVMEDFKTLMAFNKIVLSSGTFGWWAAFLSDASEIYYPLPEHFGVNRGTLFGNRLQVPDDRYVYVGSDMTYRRTNTGLMPRS